MILFEKLQKRFLIVMGNTFALLDLSECIKEPSWRVFMRPGKAELNSRSLFSIMRDLSVSVFVKHL